MKCIPENLRFFYVICSSVVIVGSLFALFNNEYLTFALLIILLVDLLITKKYFYIMRINQLLFKTDKCSWEHDFDNISDTKLESNPEEPPKDHKFEFFKSSFRRFKIDFVIFCVATTSVAVYVIIALYLNPSYQLSNTQLPFFIVAISFYFLYICYVNHKRIMSLHDAA